MMRIFETLIDWRIAMLEATLEHMPEIFLTALACLALGAVIYGTFNVMAMAAKRGVRPMEDIVIRVVRALIPPLMWSLVGWCIGAGELTAAIGSAAAAVLCSALVEIGLR